jgi:hypothetical protein
MIYYILFDQDTDFPKENNIEDIWDENQLGEHSFGTFYTGLGMGRLRHMIEKFPSALESIAILDEKNHSYTVLEFLELVSHWKIKEH